MNVYFIRLNSSSSAIAQNLLPSFGRKAIIHRQKYVDASPIGMILG
jgi:hypothetical protein